MAGKWFFRLVCFFAYMYIYIKCYFEFLAFLRGARTALQEANFCFSFTNIIITTQSSFHVREKDRDVTGKLEFSQTRKVIRRADCKNDRAQGNIH